MSLALSTLPSESELKAAQAFLGRLFPERQMRRVLLVTPPDATADIFRPELARARHYANYLPYGLGLLAQHVREAGLEPRLLNLNHLILKAANEIADPADFDFDSVWQKALDAAIADFRPDLVGVTCMFTMTHASLKNVCAYIGASGLPLAIGGVHVSNDFERVLDDIPDAHMAFLREGENAIVHLIRVVRGEAPIAALGQLILNPGQERIRFHAECRPTAKELDVIPAFELMDTADLSTYGVMGNYHGFKPQSTRFATVQSNRGCRAQCTFCSVRNFNGVSVRSRSVESVLDEIERLENDYGIGHFVWLDDDLLKDERRAIELFNGMVRRKLSVTWDATNGLIAASCTPEVVHAMAESGCIAISIGVESGNPDILKRVKKPGTVKSFLAAAEAFQREPRIHTRAFLIVGFPGETMAMINDTISLAERMQLDWYSTSVLQPLPNTPIYDAMVREGLIDQEVGSGDVRFNSGAYGKQIEMDLGMDSVSEFEDVIRSIPSDAIPTPDQTTHLWFYMNYHLNFRRLFSETRPLKLEQQRLNLTALSERISPGHGLGLYFLALVKYRLTGEMDRALVERLRARLDESPYWANRLKAFGLSVRDLDRCDFTGREIPHLSLSQARVA